MQTKYIKTYPHGSWIPSYQAVNVPRDHNCVVCISSQNETLRILSFPYLGYGVRAAEALKSVVPQGVTADFRALRREKYEVNEIQSYGLYFGARSKL